MHTFSQNSLHLPADLKDSQEWYSPSFWSITSPRKCAESCVRRVNALMLWFFFVSWTIAGGFPTVADEKIFGNLHSSYRIIIDFWISFQLFTINLIYLLILKEKFSKWLCIYCSDFFWGLQLFSEPNNAPQARSFCTADRYWPLFLDKSFPDKAAFYSALKHLGKIQLHSSKNNCGC